MKNDIDRQRIDEKLSHITQQAADLRRLAEATEVDRFVTDPWLVRGAKYALQTAVEAMIDTVYHLAAKAFSYAPTDARDAVTYLMQQGVFSNDEAEVFQEMIRFRNRVVHGYDRIDDRRVYEIIATQLGDFDRFIEVVQRFAAGLTGADSA